MVTGLHCGCCVQFLLIPKRPHDQRYVPGRLFPVCATPSGVGETPATHGERKHQEPKGATAGTEYTGGRGQNHHHVAEPPYHAFIILVQLKARLKVKATPPFGSGEPSAVDRDAHNVLCLCPAAVRHMAPPRPCLVRNGSRPGRRGRALGLGHHCGGLLGPLCGLSHVLECELRQKLAQCWSEFGSEQSRGDFPAGEKGRQTDGVSKPSALSLRARFTTVY